MRLLFGSVEGANRWVWGFPNALAQGGAPVSLDDWLVRSHPLTICGKQLSKVLPNCRLTCGQFLLHT